MSSELKPIYIATQDVTLHVLQTGSEAGPLVILLHGFPEFWYGWRYQLPILGSRGYRVWAPDQRGYNLSSKPTGIAAYSLDCLAADVVGLIEAAGREKALLVGHDWGAAVAWWTALRHPERVEKLAILNVPHPLVMRRHLKRSPRQLLRSWYMFYFQLPWLPEAGLRLWNWWSMRRALLRTSRPGTFSKEDFEKYVEAWSQPGAMKSMIHWYRAALRVKMPKLGSPRVKPPVLLIWGARDAFLGRELAEPSLELCDRGRLEVIEEASHWLQHEEPDRVNRLILEFFDNPH